MKQVLQNLRTGGIEIVEVPSPVVEPGRLLVRVEASLISAGTESHQVQSASKSIIQRVIDKPRLIRKGWRTLVDHGLQGVQDQLAAHYQGYAALGYSCAGTVMACGPGVEGFQPGQRVACGGGGYAHHAEEISVPMHLAALIPGDVPAEAAAYATVGAIAMQGVRQAKTEIGEGVVVTGLGLVGQLTVQLLRAAGCTVIGIDPNEAARKRALAGGAIAVSDLDGAESCVSARTRGIGADAIIICAATADSSPIELAARIARSRARIVMVGATGMELPREIFFRKELSFTLSRSYGPGRYDPSYEEFGCDYPVDHVRFTEQRNMQSFLDLVAEESVDPGSLTTHRHDLADAVAAYGLLSDPSRDRVGIILRYPASERATGPATRTTRVDLAAAGAGGGIGLIGAGGYARNVLMPVLKRSGEIRLAGIATRNGAQAASFGRQFGFAFTSTDPREVIQDSKCAAVIIATRHDSHASLATAALSAGKHVWVEKPLALNRAELKQVEAAFARTNRSLLIGFNRPFSPLSTWLRQQLDPQAPVMMRYRVQAGMLPANHWTNDPVIGGGRLLGEGCHFLDFMCWLCGSSPVTVHTAGIGGGRSDLPSSANFAVNVTFADGSVGQLFYTSQGAALPKEHFEVSCGNRTGVIDDFHRASVMTGAGKPREKKLATQDKGQAEMLRYFTSIVQGKTPRSAGRPFASSLLTLAAQESLQQQAQVNIAEFAARPI